VPELDPQILSYYEEGGEASRLEDDTRAGWLERERTQELLLRSLPPAPARVLDVGGAAGVYARWLADLGYEVHLTDPVPLHVEQAAADPRIHATVGDARHLDVPDASVDVVLLLGPLYHLIDRDERLLALRESFRVLRPGGRVFAAAIARGAGLLDLLVTHDRLHDPALLDVVAQGIRTGVHRGAEVGAFTTAFFHLPSELRSEVEEAGYDGVEVLGVEGPGFLVAGQPERVTDPARREAMLAAARLTEDQPEMLGALGHLLATGTRAAPSAGR
jgi:SAM-dependent methyltransferase